MEESWPCLVLTGGICISSFIPGCSVFGAWLAFFCILGDPVSCSEALQPISFLFRACMDGLVCTSLSSPNGTLALVTLTGEQGIEVRGLADVLL